MQQLVAVEVVATVSFRLDWMWAGRRPEARVRPGTEGLVEGWEAQEWLSAGGPRAEALGQRGRAGVGGWGQAAADVIRGRTSLRVLQGPSREGLVLLAFWKDP